VHLPLLSNSLVPASLQIVPWISGLFQALDRGLPVFCYEDLNNLDIFRVSIGPFLFRTIYCSNIINIYNISSWKSSSSLPRDKTITGQHRIELNKNTTVQRQTHRVPTFFKGNAKATKGEEEGEESQCKNSNVDKICKINKRFFS